MAIPSLLAAGLLSRDIDLVDIVPASAMVVPFCRGRSVKTAALIRLVLRLLRRDTERVFLEVIDYLMVEVRVLRQRYQQDCGKRLLLTDGIRLDNGSATVKDGRPVEELLTVRGCANVNTKGLRWE